MAIKGILPLPLKMILNTYYTLPPQPPQPSPQCDAPPRRPSVQQSPPPQQCYDTRVVAAEKTTVERSAENVCMEENTEGRMDPESGQLELSSTGTGQLESPSTGTGFEAPRQQCIANWDIERTSTVDGCLLVGVSLNLGKNIFSLTKLVTGTQTDSQTSTLYAPSKIVCKKMSSKLEDNEPANEKIKQFDPGGKGWEPPFEKRMYWYYFLFLGDVWTWMPGLFLVVLLVCLLCFAAGKSSDNHFFLRPKKNMGGETWTNEDDNHVDIEHNRRASIFLPINPLKINTFRFDSLATRCWG